VPQRRRYNPAVALVGLVAMMLGAVIVVTIFALESDWTASGSYVALGATTTFVGWLVQRIFGRRGHRHR